MGVAKTNNPDQKLADAHSLVWELDRPLPAESLIREAIDIYRKNNDEKGLARAYQEYAQFLASSAVERYPKTYQKYGFADQTSFDDRWKTSVKYLDLARDLYAKNKIYEGVMNVDFKLGIAYETMKRILEACDSYNRTLTDKQDYLKNDPNAKINFPKQFSRYEDYLAAQTARAGCK